MARGRPQRNTTHDDMEVQALKNEVALITRRLDEVITLLTGNAQYELPGLKNDFKKMKEDMAAMKVDIAELREKERTKWLVSFNIKTGPQKAVAWIIGAIISGGAVLTVVQKIIEIANATS